MVTLWSTFWGPAPANATPLIFKITLFHRGFDNAFIFELVFTITGPDAARGYLQGNYHHKCTYILKKRKELTN